MAILVSQTTQGTSYGLTSGDAKDTFYGLSSQAETLTYNNTTGNFEFVDVSNGDRINLEFASNNWQIKVVGNVVTLQNGTRTMTLGSLAANETVTLGFNDGKSLKIEGIAGNPTTYQITPLVNTSVGTAVALTDTLAAPNWAGVDVTAPTLLISDNEPKTTSNIADGTTTFTFTFSENLNTTTFTESDITVTGGTFAPGSLTKVDDKTFTLVVTPTPGVDAGTITVAANAKNVSDVAGNAGADSAKSLIQLYDTLAPVFSSLGTASPLENQNQLYSATTTGAPGSVTYSLKDPTVGDANLLNIDGSTGAVTLKTGSLDFEGMKNSYTFTVIATDAAGNPTEQVVMATVTNVNEAPTAIALSANTIAENVVTTGGVKIGDLTVTDPDASGNNNVLTLEGTDAALFEIRDNAGTKELFYVGTSPNFEGKPSYAVTVKSTDGLLTYSQALTVNVTNVGEDGVNDIYVGTNGPDTFDGKSGDDQITGGAGADTLTGGAGADSFKYSAGGGIDTIKDFSGDPVTGDGDVYDTDFVTSSENFVVVSEVVPNPLTGLVLDIGNAGGAGVFEFKSNFNDSIFSTGSVLTEAQISALLGAIDDGGIIDTNVQFGRFMLIMTDTGSNKSYLYEVVDTSGDRAVGSGDIHFVAGDVSVGNGQPVKMVGIFEAIAADWVTGYIV